MSGFAGWLAAQRLRRAVIIAGLFPLPVLGLLSAAVVVMTAQLRGPRESVLDCALAAAILAPMSWVTGMQTAILLVSAVISWAIWLALGTVVFRTRSLTLSIQAAVVIALIGMLALQWVAGDPAVYWRDVLEAVYADLESQGVAVQADIEQQAGVMNGLVISGSLAGAVMVLMLGTGLADRVSGAGIASQFPLLRLGYVIGILAAVAGLAALLGESLGGALLVFGAAFMFQGIALLAWWARRLAWPRGWWIGMCILPILLAEFLVVEAALLSAMGFIDNWYNLRRGAGGNAAS